MKLAVIGDPIEHSRSPQIHTRLLQDADIEGTYVALRVPKGETAAALQRLRSDGFTGCNVTTPLKEEAFHCCDILDEDAELAQAVNTIYFGERTYGANTDGVGARSALETVVGQAMALERVGILGTGSTARAILAQLRETDAYAYVWGRDGDKVRAICERFEARPWPVRAPEIVVSTLPPNANLPDGLCADLQRADVIMETNYGKRATLGAMLRREVIDGELMLEAQARASFAYWLAHLRGAVTGFAR
ncbi:MAG: hypothetical protein M3M96_07650 [Candidatus Eremiobacteraeota bacterium]|nr:hypothetical protein [Candidatus Eremiobacteraeota bacterium]